MPSHHVRVDRTRYIPSDFASVNPFDSASTQADAAYSVANSGYYNKSFQVVLSYLTQQIHASDSSEGLTQSPTSTNWVRAKAVVACTMLALMCPVGSDMRSRAIATAKSYIDKMQYIDSSDRNAIIEESRKVGEVLPKLIIDAIITQGVDVSEVNKWSKYVSALFSNIFNIAIIESAKQYKLQKSTGYSDTTARMVTDLNDMSSSAVRESLDVVQSVFEEEPPLISPENPFVTFWNSGTLPKIIVISSGLAVTVGTAFAIRHFRR